MNSVPPADVNLALLAEKYPKAIDHSLSRMMAACARLGHPERSLPPALHVAGTNGKGSTVAFLRAVMESAGLKVHVFTSPHLVRVNERIRIAGTEISDADFNRTIAEIEERCAGCRLSLFELFTLVAFVCFSRVEADYCVFEVGLGGRLDATNLIMPRICGITRISYDHMAFLGNSLPEIAGEKAGIIKQSVPCVIQAQPDDSVRAVFRETADARGARLYWEGTDFSLTPTINGSIFCHADAATALPRPGLSGAHQFHNAATALAMLAVLGDKRITDAAMAEGMAGVFWPGRLQTITSGKLWEILPDGWELVIDGGHNDSGGEILAQQAREWAATDAKRLHVIVGMLAQKKAEDFLRPLAPFIDRLVAIPAAKQGAMAVEELVTGAEHAGIAKIAQSEDVVAALHDCARHSGVEPARVLICGSLYLMGEILQY